MSFKILQDLIMDEIDKVSEEMERWITIKNYEVYVIDGKAKRAVKTDGNGGRVPAYIYRWAGDAWRKEEDATPAAIRSGLKRGTIRIL